MPIGSLYLANAYASSPGMASAYVRMNAYTRIAVSRNRDGLGWDVWMMGEGNSGTYETLRTKAGATMAAERMGRVFSLPVSFE